MSDAARFVEDMLAGRYGLHHEPLAEPDVEADFAAAVDILVADKMDRPVAKALIGSAQARGQDVRAWAAHIVRLRAEYRRKLVEVRSK